MKFTTWLMSATSTNKTLDGIIKQVASRVLSKEGVCQELWHPTPVLLPGKSHGQGSLVGCSPWGCEESDTTERLHFHFSLSCIGEGNGNPLQCSRLENPRDGGAWWAAVYGVAQSRTRLKWLSSSMVYMYNTDTTDSKEEWCKINLGSSSISSTTYPSGWPCCPPGSLHLAQVCIHKAEQHTPSWLCSPLKCSPHLSNNG